VVRRDVDKPVEKVAVVLPPTYPPATPTMGDGTIDLKGEEVDFLDHLIRFTGPGNITGLPSLSVPCGFRDGLPVGLQIMGKAFAEKTILNVADEVEQTNDSNKDKPSAVKY